MEKMVGLRRRKSKGNDDVREELCQGRGEPADPDGSPWGGGSKAKAERSDWIAQGPCDFVGWRTGRTIARRPTSTFIRRTTMFWDSGSSGLVALGRMHAW